MLPHSNLEAAFHPHRAETSPFGLETRHFKEHMWIAVTTCAVYILMIIVGLRFMENKPGFELKLTLAAWNSFLAVFSLCGALRTAPHLLSNLITNPFADSVCTAAAQDWGSGACGFWVQLFVVSKFFELTDTAFLVLRKRRVMFLHWFHHATVLLYCFHSYATEAPHALYFVAMNYCVHAAMYAYYALMAMEMKPRWLNPGVVTTSQIAQMVVGVGVQVAAFNSGCEHNRSNLFYGAAMYASYLVLFIKFAIERFILKKFNCRHTIFKANGGFSKPGTRGIPPTFPIFQKVLRTFGWSERRPDEHNKAVVLDSSSDDDDESNKRRLLSPKPQTAYSRHQAPPSSS